MKNARTGCNGLPPARRQVPADWLNQQLERLQRDGMLAFQARARALVLITASAKRPGCWQATWFRHKGPYQDRLDPSPRRLLWRIHGFVRQPMPPRQAATALQRMLC